MIQIRSISSDTSSEMSSSAGSDLAGGAQSLTISQGSADARSSFSDLVVPDVKENMGDQSRWLCDEMEIDICHVIGTDDDDVSDNTRLRRPFWVLTTSRYLMTYLSAVSSVSSIEMAFPMQLSFAQHIIDLSTNQAIQASSFSPKTSGTSSPARPPTSLFA